MSERKARNQEPGWLASAGGALLIVVAGFAIGLVAGAVFEEPALLFEQLAGRGERVAVDGVEEVELSPSRPLPSAFADTRKTPDTPAIADAPEPAAEPEARVAEKPLRSPPPVDAAPPLERRLQASGPGFAIQVGAFEDAPAARALARRLRGKGLPGFVVEAASSPWRVRVGPYPSEAEARRVAEGLQSEHELPTWVLAVGGP